MSVRITPEPISVGVSYAAQYLPRQQRTTRPVEPVEAASADRHPGGQAGTSDRRSLADGMKARPGERPPGKDPSVPPQALFDAALIAAEYKPMLEVNAPDRSERYTGGTDDDGTPKPAHERGAPDDSGRNGDSRHDFAPNPPQQDQDR